jgi:hypothetical protein
MLIVGGTAALTAILLYLVWHFYRQWRTSLRRREAEQRLVLSQGRQHARRAQEARQFDPVR